MTTSLATLRQELSKQLDDYWAGTTTADGNDAKTSLLDSALTEKESDWITSGASGEVASTVLITDSALTKEERVVSSFTIANGTVTVKRAFTAKITSAKSYEINRLFTAAEKERAIQFGCYTSFPALYKQVHDESIQFGNWLRNGGMEIWSIATCPDYWRLVGAGLTAAQNAVGSLTRKYRGNYSAEVTRAGTDGYMYQYPGDNRDLLDLAGKGITFYNWTRADTASQGRIAIAYVTSSGTTVTYSNYHTGDSAWRELSVAVSIPQYISNVEFRCCVETTNGTVLFDSARVAGVGGKYAYDLAGLGLYLNQPHQIRKIVNEEYPDSSYALVTDWMSPTTDSKIRFRKALSDDSFLQITGIGYLTQPTATVSTEVNAPQYQIIIAEAAVFLYDLLLNRSPSQNVARYEAAKNRWRLLASQRRAQFGMPLPAGTVNY